MKKYIIYIFILIFFTKISLAQEQYINELKFVKHLNKNLLFGDIIANSKYIDFAKLTIYEQDSLNYYVGKAYYKLNIIDTSTIFFDKIKLSQELISKSNILNFNYFVDNYKFTEAEKSLSKINLNDNHKKEFYARGILLLNNRISNYEAKLTINPKAVYKQEILDLTYEKYKLFKRKSPALAGVLSSVIPGLGRVYANKPLHGLVSFVPVTWFGYSAYEGYNNNGFNSPNFYIFSSLFTIFYIGNIWGSVFTAKNRNEERVYEINEELFNNINIPID